MRSFVRLVLVFACFAPVARGADKPGRLNHLANETSPYLLQHARNPVDWYPWGPEAFAKAKAENKPIFLSVGYSSCFWCHVMERESFEDAEVARLLNEKFVAIKVDREERPDVDAVYMAVLQAFAGSGGWPMTVFLFPDGRPFFAGTYFPPRDRPEREGLIPLLGRAADAWRDQKPLLDKDADTLTKAARKAATLAADRAAVPLTRSLLDAGQAALAEQFDPDFGGFGSRDANRPKFPEPSNLVFLLDRAATKNLVREGKLKGPEPRTMILTTLDHMARGGIRDHLGGGYHRYSVNRSWTVPHFEKMLYDNAQIASVHLQAFELTQDSRWRAEAEATLAFMTRKLRTPDGAFASSIDAETDGDEGGYYVWKKSEVQTILGGDFDTFARVYGLDRPSNFEGDRYILQERLQYDAIDPETRLKLAPMREKLLAARQKRPAPRLDDKILTAWNGLAIAAYADAFRILKNPEYREIAEKAADFLLQTHRDGGGKLLRTSRHGTAKGAAYLEDYAFLAHGLLRLHAVTGDPKWLAQSQKLIDRMIADFSDPTGGFFFTADGGESLIARMKDPFDNALPSGNSVAILDLMDLATLTRDTSYADVAGRSLRGFSPLLSAMPSGAPLMLVGLGEFLDVRGEDGSGDTPKPAKTPALLSAEVTVGKRSDGGEVELLLALTIREGWHIAAHPSDSQAIAATEIKLGNGFAGNLVGVEYPPGKSMASPGGGGAMSVYEGKVTLKVRVRTEKPGPTVAELLIHYQPCNDRACLAPALLRVPVSAR